MTHTQVQIIKEFKTRTVLFSLDGQLGFPLRSYPVSSYVFFFQNPPLLFLLSVLRLGPVLKKFRRPGVTQFQWTVVTKFWREFNFVDWRLFVFCGN